MNDIIKTSIRASLAGDALTLGVHWDYDPSNIAAQHGRVEQFIAPGQGSYHKGKEAGDFTHYGDQTLVLLESVAAQKGFDLEDFFRRWNGLFDDYAGYVDGATRRTRERIAFGEGPEGSGSPSNDLAGASRIAPLFGVIADIEPLVAAARAQTAMTHNEPHVVEASAFFTRAAHGVIQGKAPRQAMEDAAAESPAETKVPEWVEAGLEAVDIDSVAAIGDFGRTCHIPDALPGVVQLIAKYADDPREALIQNAMAGGDSAARALPVGLILGPRFQGEAAEWLAGLRFRREDHIDGLLRAL